MNDEIKFASDHSDVESRVFAFRSCMEPALHLFPESIVERLKGGGFFTAPASTKYHGAYEGGLFEHSHKAEWPAVGTPGIALHHRHVP